MSRGAKIGLWVLVLAAVVAVFAVTGARRLKKEDVESIESVQAAEGIPVDVVRSQVVLVEDWREFVGVAEGYEQIDLIAAFRTRVNGVHARVGEQVSAGDVLVSLDPFDPAHFGMNLRTNEAQYETARQDSVRIEALFARGAVSEQDLDHVRASAEAARAQYLSARRAVELDTPIAGIVTALNVEAGDYAAAEQTLATVSSYDRMRIPLELSESERSRIQVGQPARLRVGEREAGTKGCDTGSGFTGAAERALRGSVVKAALSADPTTRLFAVEVVIDNPGHELRPGTLVTPEILVAAADDLPVVPPIALVKHDGQEQVFVIESSGGSGRARLHNVTRGIEHGALVSIADGISPGDIVVVWGQNNLNDGARVKIHAERTADYYPDR